MAGRQKYYAGLFVVFSSPFWLIGSAVAIKAAVFPFASVEVLIYSDFDKSEPEFRNIELSSEFIESVRTGNPDAYIKAEEGETEEAARLLAKWTREHFRHGNNTVIESPQEVLESEGDVEALCSEYAKFYVSSAQALGIEGRVLWMNDHTISELWDEKTNRPFIADTNGNVIFRNDDETLASMTEIIQGRKSLPERFVEDLGESNDPDFSNEGKLSLYVEQNLVLEIEGAHLFDFQKRNWSPGVIIDRLLGGDGVARGRQLRISDATHTGRGAVYFGIGFVLMIFQIIVGATYISKVK